MLNIPGHHFLFRLLAQQHHQEKMDQPVVQHRNVRAIQNTIQGILQSRIRRHHGRYRKHNRLQYSGTAKPVSGQRLRQFETILYYPLHLQLHRLLLESICHENHRSMQNSPSNRAHSILIDRIITGIRPIRRKIHWQKVKIYILTMYFNKNIVFSVIKKIDCSSNIFQ